MSTSESNSASMDLSMNMDSSTASIATSATATTSPIVASNMDPFLDAVATSESLASTIVKQDSRLLKLPEEIKQNIWKLVVIVKDPIAPVQLRAKSNKFLWSKDQHVQDPNTRRTNIVISAAKPLDVVALSAVCKQIYQEVSLTHIFYKENQFQFLVEGSGGCARYRSSELLNYLAAITAPRREAIHSISVKLGVSYWRNFPVEHTFTMLSECKHLQVLSLHVDAYALEYDQVNHLRGFKELKDAVKGLSVLTIHFENESQSTLKVSSLERKEEFKSILEKERTAPKVAVSRIKVQNAMLYSDLDIHGEGRLSEDKKPGVIASRTRQRLRGNDSIHADGTFPERETPKYDLDGTLAWTIVHINASREIVTDFGDIGVEFCVDYNTIGNHRCSSGEEESWEDMAVLDPIHTVDRIVQFYEHNRDAFGKELVLQAWKQRAPLDAREQHRMNMGAKHLGLIIRQEAAKQAHEEAAATRAAKKAAGKKTAGKKAAGKKRA
ncbi:hypothetical protein EG329_002756 [Mollisiaceae sp. DMI_Dod_QoI]|nr:hypothetical protein EG329_002756 [Helotiales sp. DMI_Dod_QoI]